jgi:hypothetical protein
MQAHLLENPDELLEITEMSHSIELVILAHLGGAASAWKTAEDLR